MNTFAVKMLLSLTFTLPEGSCLPDYSKIVREFILRRLISNILEREILKEWFNWVFLHYPSHYKIDKSSGLGIDGKGVDIYKLTFPRVLIFKSQCTMWPLSPIYYESEFTYLRRAVSEFKCRVLFDGFIVHKVPSSKAKKYLESHPLSELETPFHSRSFSRVKEQ
ncbi:TPA_asm: M [Vicia betacytorhabdovirus 1]|nr:TPA_asm: M [Vicia betacytorhabdovirus 1]